MSLIIFFLILTFIVVVHEFGHFLFSRLFGVKVEEFAVGFGPAFFKIKGKKTTFRFNVFPLGGYVRLAGEDELSEDKVSDDPELLINKKPWQKFLIALAGPAFSILLGYFLYAYIGSFYGFNITKIQAVSKDMPAYSAGIESGDKILKVNGKYAFDPMVLNLSLKSGKSVSVELLKKNGLLKKVNVTPKLSQEQNSIILNKFKGNIGNELKGLNGSLEYSKVLKRMEIGDPIELKTEDGILKGFLENSTISPRRYMIGIAYAYASNIISKDTTPFLKGDKIISIDDKPINLPYDMNSTLLSRLYDSMAELNLEKNDIEISFEKNKITKVLMHKDFINIKVIRNNKEFTFSIDKNKLESLTKQGAIVIQKNIYKLKPSESISASIQWTNTLLNTMIDFVVRLFSGKENVKQLTSIVGVGVMVDEARKEGIQQLLSLIALITLNLGIINLLPLPALDGGRIVFSLIEMITRKKINPKIEAIIHTVGFFILFAFGIYIIFQDIFRFF
ncbi:putative zinc metalloprotease [Tepiditoga spiralis]|uniref:Putative zinc metalloprotease n=1 Tax=Tepiditoga spiralis TaxID=2108365 RepID=A0A7G1G8U0_9BACT|nr:site-2 protease family protein [Tepiditoga spiralis]BBE31387.1 putative zinc metalloprotease [Tepiditoga spiralis]